MTTEHESAEEGLQPLHLRRRDASDKLIVEVRPFHVLRDAKELKEWEQPQDRLVLMLNEGKYYLLSNTILHWRSAQTETILCLNHATPLAHLRLTILDSLSLIENTAEEFSFRAKNNILIFSARVVEFELRGNDTVGSNNNCRKVLEDIERHGKVPIPTVIFAQDFYIFLSCIAMVNNH